MSLSVRGFLLCVFVRECEHLGREIGEGGDKDQDEAIQDAAAHNEIAQSETQDAQRKTQQTHEGQNIALSVCVL